MREHVVPLSRQRILNAAMQVAARDGVLAMTLDAVAREAGISKGGLIHHFRTKDDLISAMLEHFRVQTLETMEERIALVWPLTQQSWAIAGEPIATPGIQRDVVHIVRGRR